MITTSSIQNLIPKGRKDMLEQKAYTATNLFFTETIPGRFFVCRAEGELPFAELIAPRHLSGRNWGIVYRNFHKPHFDGFISSYPSTRKSAEQELKRMVVVCSDYQLGLTDNVT